MRWDRARRNESGGKAESVEGTRNDWERENRWEDWILEEGRRRQRAKGIFFVHVWREWEPLIHLTAWVWPGLRPRLVYTAGCFPERAAQGRGTCSSLNHWSRGEPDRRGEGCWDGKMLAGSRKRTRVRFLKSSGKTEWCSQKKIFGLVSSPWTSGGGHWL